MIQFLSRPYSVRKNFLPISRRTTQRKAIAKMLQNPATLWAYSYVYCPPCGWVGR